MSLDDYVKHNDRMTKFSNFKHQSGVDNLRRGLNQRFISDDLLDAMYVRNNVLDDENLSVDLFIGVFSSLHHLIRIYGQNLELEDSSYLDPLLFNLGKYPLDEILSSLTPGSRDLFRKHYEEVLQIFGPKADVESAARKDKT